MVEMPSIDKLKAMTIVSEEEPEQEEKLPANSTISRDSIIESQREKNLRAISKNEDFQKASLMNDMRAVGAKLQEEENETWQHELENEYKQYELKKYKETLDYKTKKEKHIVKEKVKAEVAKQKYDIALARYGYLYKPQLKQICDDNGNPVLDKDGNPVTTVIPAKDFTPNKFINKTKELVNFYANLSDEIKKAICVTLKLVLIIGGIAIVGVGLKMLVDWLVGAGVLNIAI